MRMFEADSTASARLVKTAYLKLYNRMQVRTAVDVLLSAYAEMPPRVKATPQKAKTTMT